MKPGRRKWLVVGGAFILVGAVVLAGGGLLLWGSTQACLMAHCLHSIRTCDASEECSAWMECMQGCGDDEMLCPTVCGAFYQAPEINAFVACALEAKCIDIDFSALPPCKLPRGERVAVGTFDGFWWVSAIRGHEYVLYDDCQRFVFTTLDDTSINVHNSTLVSYRDETRLVDNTGVFTRMSDGSLGLVYENWVGYTEHYNPMYVTDQVMLMHVCSAGTQGEAHDYGALVLTRTSLEDLESSERDALEAAIREIYSVSLDEFRPIGTLGCANGP